jgi:fructose-1,6-bisphosphatase II
MDRNLALEFVRVTEGAAIASARFHGRGDKNGADGAAVSAMRERLSGIDFAGIIVSGEGEKDSAPMLYVGEQLGTGKGVEVDIAVDPLECTTHLSEGRPNSMSVIALGERGGLLPTPGTYMEQLAVGKSSAGKVDITAPLKDTVKAVAKSVGKEVEDLVVAILLRERNQPFIEEVRQCGARVTLFDHGTVAHGIAPALEDNTIDMMFCIGGAPEAVLTACALKCLDGELQARFRPHNQKVREEMRAFGYSEDQVFRLEDLAKGKVMFVATGITDGPLLSGVRFYPRRITTHSVVMRSSTGTIRFVEAHHRHDH